MEDEEQTDHEETGAIDLMRQQRDKEKQKHTQRQMQAPLQQATLSVPLWSNLNLPSQEVSIVAHAALMPACRRSCGSCPAPADRPGIPSACR